MKKQHHTSFCQGVLVGSRLGEYGERRENAPPTKIVTISLNSIIEANKYLIPHALTHFNLKAETLYLVTSLYGPRQG